MTDSHICLCEGACTCGRPKGRPSNQAIAAASVRLAQLEQGMFEGGSPVPTQGDVEFVSSTDPRHARTAGRLLTDWMNQGQIPGLAPQRTARWRRRDGSPDSSLSGVA